MKNWIVPEFQRSETKRVPEEINAILDFSDQVLPYFGKLVSATFTAEKWPISDPDTKTDGTDIFKTDGTGLIAFPYLTHAQVKVHGGTVDYDYHLTCIAVTDIAETLERDFIIRVR